MDTEYDVPLSAVEGCGKPCSGFQPAMSGTRADTCCTVRNVYVKETKVSMALRSYDHPTHKERKMEALKAIGWALWLIFATVLVFRFVGIWTMTTFFPEGQRGWHFPAQIGALAFFAAAVLCNPWQ